MNKSFWNYLILIILFTLFTSCNGDNDDTPGVSAFPKDKCLSYHKKNFNTLMDSVQKWQEPLDWVYNEEFLKNSAFLEIFEHGPCYYSDVIQVLKDNHFSKDKAWICVFAMQRLPVDEYLPLANIYFNLFERGKISEGFLEYVIAPNFLRMKIIPNNYDKPEVAALLTRIYNNKKISKDFRSWIDDILHNR